VRELQSQAPADDSKRLAKSLQTVQTGALSLHAAITSGWATGCHAAHRVMLNLKSNAGLHDQKTKPRSLRKEPIIFQLFVSADQDLAGTRLDLAKWHSVSILLQQESWDTAPPSGIQAPPHVLAARSPNSRGGLPSQVHTMPKVTITSASFSLIQTSIERSSQPITDICVAAQQCFLKSQSLCLEVATGRFHMPTLRSPPSPGWAQQQVFAMERQSVTDLGNFLRKTSHIEDHQIGY
jgi:hypothetical protein